MPLVVNADPVPLRTDADGVVRIGSTRVTLDTLVSAFRDGMTVEGIVEQYPSLRLADVYSVIGYVLAHQKAIDGYLGARAQQADEVRRENETRFDPAGVRARLLARQRDG
jgi:uncharacterized protein (DUF433 family)